MDQREESLAADKSGLLPAAQREALPQPLIDLQQSTHQKPLPTPAPMPCLCWSQSQQTGVRAEQRDGLSPNRGCRAALHQTPPTRRAGTQQTRHQGKCVPSPTHGNTTAGENPVVLREHYLPLVQQGYCFTILSLFQQG